MPGATPSLPSTSPEQASSSSSAGIGTALVGQIAVLGPLAGSTIAQHLFSALCAVVALTATYAVLERRLSRRRALFGVAIVAVFPAFSLLATSFMTDMPSFMGVMLAIVAFDRFMAERRVAWFAVALLVSIWAITVREQSLAVLAAITVVGAWKCREQRRQLLALTGLALLLLLAFEVWRRMLPNGDPPVFWLSGRGLTDTTPRLLLTVGFVLAPAAIAIARPQRWSRWGWFAAALATGLAGYTLICAGDSPFLMNYLDRYGSYAAAFDEEVAVIPLWWWAVVVAIAVVGFVCLVGQLVSRPPRPDALSLIIIVLIVVGIPLQATVGQMVFERYLLPALPFLLVVVLSSPNTVQLRVAVPVLAIVALTSMALTLATLSLDAARWRTAETLASEGWARERIDAGLEWNGTHLAGPEPGTWGWSGWCADAAPPVQCVALSKRPSEGARGFPFARFAWFGQDQVFAVERGG